MKSIRPLASVLAFVALAGASVAQVQHTSQKWVSGNPPHWETATADTYDGNAVTSQSEGDENFWVVWAGGVRLYRVNKNDKSLSDQEKARFEEAEQQGKGVQVEVVKGPDVQSVTIRP